MKTRHLVAALLCASTTLIAATANASPLTFNRTATDLRTSRASSVMLNPQPLPPSPCKNCPVFSVKPQRYQGR